MHCKKLISLFLTLLTVFTLSAGPKQKNALSHIKFGKCKIVSFVPTGLRSVRAGIEIEAKNDTAAFQLQDVKLTVFRKGSPFVDGVCEEVTVPKGTSTLRLTGEFELCDDVSLWSAVSALRDPDLSEFTGNVDLTVVADKGRKVAYSQKNISLSSLSGRKVEQKADGKVSTGNGAAKSTASPAPQKTERSKQTAKPQKRPWWQFWKK